MMQTLDVVMEFVNALSLEDKHQLWQILDEEIQAEEQNSMEDKGMYQAILEVKDEVPMSLSEALEEMQK